MTTVVELLGLVPVYGLMLPLGLAAVATGVSRQSIVNRQRRGTLATLFVMGQRMVSLTEMVDSSRRAKGGLRS